MVGLKPEEPVDHRNDLPKSSFNNDQEFCTAIRTAHNQIIYLCTLLHVRHIDVSKDTNWAYV
jgi:hypothetical protein